VLDPRRDRLSYCLNGGAFRGFLFVPWPEPHMCGHFWPASMAIHIVYKLLQGFGLYQRGLITVVYRLLCAGRAFVHGHLVPI